MRFLTILFFFIIHNYLCATPYNLKVTIKDYESFEPLYGIKVTFKTKKNYILKICYSDKNGEVNFENTQEKELIISVNGEAKGFSNFDKHFIKKKESDLLLNVYIANFEKYRRMTKDLARLLPIDTAELTTKTNCPDSVIDAEYVGGQTEMVKFLKKTLRYPKRALSEKIGGRCYLRFYIDPTGSISNITVTRGVPECPECDYEAVLAISKMPNWIPAECDGIKRGMFYNLPIKFNPD